MFTGRIYGSSLLFDFKGRIYLSSLPSEFTSRAWLLNLGVEFTGCVYGLSVQVEFTCEISRSCLHVLFMGRFYRWSLWVKFMRDKFLSCVYEVSLCDAPTTILNNYYFEFCLLAWVFWVKTQAKTLEWILVRKYAFNLSVSLSYLIIL